MLEVSDLVSAHETIASNLSSSPVAANGAIMKAAQKRAELGSSQSRAFTEQHVQGVMRNEAVVHTRQRRT
jgi:hypothetical protein